MIIPITPQMRAQVTVESERRNAFIRHHFEVDHLTGQQRDEIGFLGEFACATALGLNWQENIRLSYQNIDDFDLIYRNRKIDVKTGTVPRHYAIHIINGTINDDLAYGRRLINQGQFELLRKYDLVVFGMFIRDNYDYWYSIGYIDTNTIGNNYAPTNIRPDGGRYPVAGSPVPTSILTPLENLIP